MIYFNCLCIVWCSYGYLTSSGKIAKLNLFTAAGNAFCIALSSILL